MRRLFTLLFLAAAASAGVRAQTAETAAARGEGPGLAVVKFDWSRELLPWEGTDFIRRQESFEDIVGRTRGERRARERRGVFPAEGNRIERETRTDPAADPGPRRPRPERPRFGFRYKATFQNDGAKPVAAIDWDYVFYDAATRREVGRRQFTSEKKVAPGKKKECSFFVLDPPSLRVSADALGRKERDALAGEVVVVRVVYADGTVWQRRTPPPRRATP